MRAPAARAALSLLPPLCASALRREIAPGVTMPAVSIGHPDDGSNVSSDDEQWLKLGGSGIDTATSYHNQDQIGAAVRASGKARGDVFITTKILTGSKRSPHCVPPKGGVTVDTTVAAVQACLDELKMDYVDLALLHFPCKSTADTQAAWRGLQQAQKRGLARAVGVSNFAAADLDVVLALGGTPPAVNQCQMSIGSHDDATISYTQRHNITYEAYSPLRRVDLSDSRVAKIAAAHGKSAAQVALRWVYQQGVPIATSPGSNAQYMADDLAVTSFALTVDEMRTLGAI